MIEETFTRENEIGIPIEYTVIGNYVDKDNKEYKIYTNFAPSNDIYGLRIKVDENSENGYVPLETDKEQNIVDQFHKEIEKRENTNQNNLERKRLIKELEDSYREGDSEKEEQVKQELLPLLQKELVILQSNEEDLEEITEEDSKDKSQNLKKQLKKTSSLKEKIALEGKLIQQIKSDIKACDNNVQKQELRLELLEELQKHKETIKNIRSSSEEKLTIPENVYYKVQEIATAIEIFSEKHDVIEKLKNAGVSTAASTVFALALGAGITVATGGTLTLPTLASIAPVASYIGLSNILRAGISKTSWEEFLKDTEMSEEDQKVMKEFCEKYIKGNKELIDLVQKSRTNLSLEELTKTTEDIIKVEKEVEKQADVKATKYVMNAEILSQMNLLKKCYEQQKKDFIKDKNEMTNQDFIDLEKKSLVLEGEMFNRNNHAAETGKELGKDIALNTAIIYGTRLCLSALYPAYGINSLADMITPAAISVLNSVTNVDQIKNKIKVKESKYAGQYIKANANLKETLNKYIQKKNEVRSNA